MRLIRGIVIVAMIAATLMGCTNNREELIERATRWSKLLMQLHDMQESQAINELEKFIEPSAGREARVLEYYKSFTVDEHPYELLRSSVDEISFNPDKSTAIVRYTSVYRDHIGDTRTASQKTRWLRVEGTWYRAVVVADVKLN